MIDKILEKLNVEKLDEQAKEEVKGFLEELVSAKAEVLAGEISEKKITELEEKFEEYKEQEISKLEEKFEEYKDQVLTKFSDFVDEVFEDELSIPESVLEFARKGELYSDLIEQFKVRIGIDEGVIDDEVRGLLGEAKEEIERLEGELNKKIDETFELRGDAKEMAQALYIREKCDGLPEAKRVKAMRVLEGLTTKEAIDEKFEFVRDHILTEADDNKPKIIGECTCGECGYETGITEGSCSTNPCPECGAEKMEEAGKGKGTKELEEEVKDPKDGNSVMEHYKNILRKK
jgi:DNA repair exonuclease SbcCD ATPase subunit